MVNSGVGVLRKKLIRRVLQYYKNEEIKANRVNKLFMFG
jgi:hypothetical protein